MKQRKKFKFLYGLIIKDDGTCIIPEIILENDSRLKEIRENAKIIVRNERLENGR